MRFSGPDQYPAALALRRVGTAFTLVELLVVMGVVAVLLSLLIPVLSSAKRSGQAAASTNNLRELAAANFAYAGEHDGVFCPAQDQRNLVRWHGARTSANSAFDPGKGYLSPYLGQSGRVKVCPLFQNILTGSKSFENGTGGYGYNEWYVGGTPAAMFQPNRQVAIARPAQTVMFTTTAYANGSSVQEYPFCEPPFWPGADGNPSGGRPSPTVHFRFRGLALVAWCDGHVSAERRQDRDEGDNPHGGEAAAHDLGWFGPDAGNGYWNSQRDPSGNNGNP